jgi:glycosyltransferase involved in cell wall biosynthesis
MQHILFSHPTGNANVRAILASLFTAKILKEFHTTIAAYPDNVWEWLSRSSLGREFERRTYDERFQSSTMQHPCRELLRMLATRLKISRLTRHEVGLFSIDAIYRSLDRKVARRMDSNPDMFNGVYAYEDGALESFRVARKLGIRCYYDLPIAFTETAQRLLHEEAARLPAWESTLGGGTRDSTIKLRRKVEELELADTVLCPSSFVADSIPEKSRANKTVVVASFGSPTVGSAKSFTQSIGKRIRVLFVGSMTQRKGLADLFTAMRILNRNDVELVVMGSLQARMEFYRKQFPDFIYEPGRPHAQVLELMRSCDVFCLPSIVEGRALVMQEAMSQGLPLIITANTGGEDLIEEGATGFLAPIRQPDYIAEKIAWFADHRAMLSDMSRAAQAKAAGLTWEKYGQTIANAVLDQSKSVKEIVYVG